MNKTLLKIIMITSCVIACITATLGIMFYFHAIYDAPAPDDSAYKTTCNPVPPETNAITTLEKLKGKVKTDLKDYPELEKDQFSEKWDSLLEDIKKHNDETLVRLKTKIINLPEVLFNQNPAREGLDRFFQGDISDPELQTALRTLVISRNQEALAILAEAMKKPNLQFAPLLAESGTSPHFNQSAVMEVNKIARMTWQNTKDGKGIFAWDDALANFQFAKRYGTAENATLLSFLVALACEEKASSLMIENIGNLEDGEVARKTASILNNDALTPADLQFWPKMEYATMDEAIRETEHLAEVKRKNTLLRYYLFKPNETRQRALDICKSMSQAIERGDQTLGLPPMPDVLNMSFVGKRIYAWSPNPIGRMMVDLAYGGNLDKIYQGILDNLARLRVRACAFALRAYWLDHGRLPNSLDELAPQYIKTVPLDIFGGKPLQYDHDRAVVYSAGPKQIYDAGKFAREPNAHPTDERPFVLLNWDAQK